MTYDGAGTVDLLLDGVYLGTYSAAGQTTATRRFSFDQLGAGVHTLHIRENQSPSVIDTVIVPGSAPFLQLMQLLRLVHRAQPNLVSSLCMSY